MVVAARARQSDGTFPFPVSFLLQELLPQPDKLERWAALLRVAQKLRLSGLMGLLPGGLGAARHLLPSLPARSLRSTLPKVVNANGERRHRVGFFLGCVMSLVFPRASLSTVQVLAQNGCEIVTPKETVCCGALHLSWGDEEGARALAQRNIEVFEEAGVDTIVTDCAACGATSKEYHQLLADDDDFSERAKAFSEKTQDITQFLTNLSLKPLTSPIEGRVTYHDPCHLVHAQGVSREPRSLIDSVPGLEQISLNEADSCCGSAGNYALSHPTTSSSILARKMSNIADTGAETVVTANPGCLLQLQLGAKRFNPGLQVVHLTELLARGYGLSGA
jgi:glycolate oxidase iron-sulfur subunit